MAAVSENPPLNNPSPSSESSSSSSLSDAAQTDDSLWVDQVWNDKTSLPETIPAPSNNNNSNKKNKNNNKNRIASDPFLAKVNQFYATLGAEIVYNNEKGRHVVAKKNLPRGTTP